MFIRSSRIAVALSLGLLLAAQTARADALDSAVAQQRQAFLANHPGYGNMGMQISIVRAGGTDQRIYPYGLTATTNGTAVTANTRFLVNSVTKTFTAMLGAVMEHLGLIPGRLDATLPTLMTYPAVARDGSRNIELLDLATHWSGLVRDPVGSVTDKALLYSDVSDDTGDPYFTYCVDGGSYCTPPGEFEVYSNWGYSVLGDILGDIYYYGGTVGHESDAPMWKTALYNLVNGTLGLSVTTASSDTIPSGAASGYTDITKSRVPLEYSRIHDYRWPGGGLWLNANGAIIWMNTNLENWGSVSGETTAIQDAVAERIRYGWHQYGTTPVSTAIQGLAWLFRHDTVTATGGGSVAQPVWMMRKDGSGDGYYAYYAMVPRHDPIYGTNQVVNGTNIGGYGVAIHTNFGDWGTGSTNTLESDIRQMAHSILSYIGTMPMN